MANRIFVETDEGVGCWAYSALGGGGSGLLLALPGEPGILSVLLLFPNFKALFAKNIVSWGKPDSTYWAAYEHKHCKPIIVPAPILLTSLMEKADDNLEIKNCSQLRAE